ncbi:DNA cytosine methyltransferase [Kosakonia sacchari]|uniref:DNA cytosine methyltransferase n=1 Tax=Kosakonia sacchari TaxID=1158459 RepID=UPI00158527E1|nr:DNA cytosine methyltransferase [Kosakonia sacchari]NUL35092.1 DNA cytosine methyltransferase [Kosakonia sacchari]
MNELALFAGAGGGILAGNLLGWRTVCAVERDAYAAQVLAQRQNDGILRPFPIWSDVCSFDGKPWRGIVDVVSGGFPCQAFSRASRGRITARDMWPEMLRIIWEIEPNFVFAENVSKIAIKQAAEDLIKIGYSVSAINLSAKDLGADHIRERFWLLAYTNYQGELLSSIHAKVEQCEEFYHGVWSTYPNEPGMDDGMAYRVDRFKAIGNGQVPRVAAAAFSMLRNK